MALIDWDDLPRRVNEDGEFRLASRFWDARLRLDLGAESWRLCFRDGELREIERCAGDSSCELRISAPVEEWEHLLAPLPRPFYQDLIGAQLHHGFQLNPEPIDYAAYYPALRRVIEILREARED
jgi:hypothetical protein